MKVKNHYKTLGVDENATHKEIEIAFKKFAKKYHPDNNLNQDTTGIMQEGMRAYQTLSNEQSRKAYDLSLKNSQHSPDKSYQSSTNKNKDFDEFNEKYEAKEDWEERERQSQRAKEEQARKLQREWKEQEKENLQRRKEFLQGAKQKDASIEKIIITYINLNNIVKYINLNNIDNICNGSNGKFNTKNIMPETSRRK